MEGTRFPPALQVQLDEAAVLQKLAVCSHNNYRHLFTFIPVVVSHQGHKAGGGGEENWVKPNGINLQYKIQPQTDTFSCRATWKFQSLYVSIRDSVSTISSLH